MKKFTIFMIVVDILVASCFVLVYGIPSFKNKIISTAMVTKTHKYIAYIFYDEETIDKVTAQNRYIPLTDKVNLDEIVINTSERDSYDNKYDEEILTRDPNNEDYKYIKVKVGKYNAHLVAIYDPSRVKLIASKTFNTGHGQERIKDMCKRSDGIVCINGGRFNDTTGYGSDIPKGTLIKDGKIIWSDTSEATSLIGFNKENKLVLTESTAQDALAMGMRDALEFGPFLIVNGKASFIKGNGGWGEAPRTAIGQRKDGIVLFLVIDGRMVGRPGADMVDLTEIMQKYGAYNAANLDGGTSCGLVVNGQLINDPVNGNGKHKTRMIATGFIVKK